MKKITNLLFILFVFYIAPAQITTLEFNGAFVNITGFVPSPATGNITLSDGLSYTVASVGGGSGIVTRNSSGQLAYTMDNDQSYHSFARTDGSEFKLESLNITFNIPDSDTNSATVSGLKDGETVIGAFYAVTFTQNVAENIDVSGNPAFEDIDEIRIHFNENVDTNNATTLLNTIRYSANNVFNENRIKVDFEPPTWPTATGGQSTVSGGVFLDGDIRLSLSSGDFYVVDNDGNGGTQALLISNFINGEELTIESVAGDEFDLDQVIVNTFATSLDANFISAEGFKNGISTGIQNTGVGFTTFPSVGQYAVFFDNSIFDDVDRVVITSGNVFGFSLNVIDDIVLRYNTGPLSSSDTTAVNSISVLPNPVKSTFQLNSNGAQIQNIIIYDILGKAVYEKKSTDQEIFNIYHLKSGYYILKITTDKGTSVKRIIKE